MLDKQGHPADANPTSWRMQASTHRSGNATGQQGGVVLRPPSMLKAVRLSTDVSRAITQLLAYFEEQVKMDTLQSNDPFTGRKSGRYNVTDITNVKPEFKGPSEGYITNFYAKKPAYDDRSMAQSVSGQLHNITKVEEPILVKEMLHWVTLSIRDAVAIPLLAVRVA